MIIHIKIYRERNNCRMKGSCCGPDVSPPDFSWNLQCGLSSRCAHLWVGFILAARGGGTGSSSPNFLNLFLSSRLAGEMSITLNIPLFSSSRIVAALKLCLPASPPSLLCWPRCATALLVENWCTGWWDGWSLWKNCRRENRGTRSLPLTISNCSEKSQIGEFKSTQCNSIESKATEDICVV